MSAPMNNAVTTTRAGRELHQPSWFPKPEPVAEKPYFVDDVPIAKVSRKKRVAQADSDSGNPKRRDVEEEDSEDSEDESEDTVDDGITNDGNVAEDSMKKDDVKKNAPAPEVAPVTTCATLVTHPQESISVLPVTPSSVPPSLVDPTTVTTAQSSSPLDVLEESAAPDSAVLNMASVIGTSTSASSSASKPLLPVKVVPTKPPVITKIPSEPSNQPTLVLAQVPPPRCVATPQVTSVLQKVSLAEGSSGTLSSATAMEYAQPVTANLIAVIQTAFESMTVKLPKKMQDCITDINIRDLSTLYGKRWLNGDMVDFLVQLFAVQNLSEENWEILYLATTYFYRIISDGGYPRGIMRKLNLFSKKFVMMPVNELFHWMFVVLINPLGAIVNEDGTSNGQCRLLVCNSISTDDYVIPYQFMFREKVVHWTITNWMANTFEKQQPLHNLSGRLDADRVELVIHKEHESLLQNNKYDCGLFTSFFAKAIFSKFENFQLHCNDPVFDILNISPEVKENVSNLPRQNILSQILPLIDHPNKHLIQYENLKHIQCGQKDRI